MSRFHELRARAAALSPGWASLLFLTGCVVGGTLAVTLAEALAPWVSRRVEAGILGAAFWGFGYFWLRLFHMPVAPESSRAVHGEVVVGADGLRWRGAHGIELAPWSAVKEARVVPGGVRLALVSTVRLLEVDEPDALVESIQRAKRAWDAREPVDIPESLLAAGSSSPVLPFDGASDYGRAHGAIPRELLVRIAADHSADRLARVASARALASAPATVKARVRIAIDELADEDLAADMREALDRELG